MKEEPKKINKEKALVEKAEKKVEQRKEHVEPRAKSREDKQLTKEEKKSEVSKKAEKVEEKQAEISKKAEKEEKTTESKILTINEALEELRKQDKRKFIQSIDLLINLKDFDVKKQSVNLFVTLPHKIKDVRVCAFLEKKSNLVDTITPSEFIGYKEKKELKKLVKNYNFFMANAKLMSSIAVNFGRVLGTAGKMPSPQLGIVTDESETNIKTVLHRFEKVVRIKTKEPSIKICIGKENIKNEEIAENIKAAYNAVLNSLPKNKENIRNVMIKFSMTKPIKIEVK